MCGIAGFIGEGREEELWGMIGTLRYRGPDFQAVYHHENVGLAHARLSIIDLSAAANQPFFSEDRSTAIVFNGEIYNFKQLRSELEKFHGIHFQTNSDTEVLLTLYQVYGEEMFEKINGMFAFAIYDFGKNQLLLARDRMGKKPLYYAHFGSTFIFASEPKAILRHPLAKKEINLNALNEYLTFDYIPTTSSIFSNISKLEPGSYLIYKDGKISKKGKYWAFSFKPSHLSFEDALAQLGNLLDQSVSDRLISDVPLGIFLSGGIDSSTIAYYAQKNSSTKVQTFSIGFEDHSYDESAYAKRVSEHLGTQHHVEWFGAKDLFDLLPEISEKMDEPLADPSLLPTSLLSKYTRKHVTVALGGDGSDELLAGYPTFYSNYLIPSFSRLPQSVHAFLKKLATMLPVNDDNMSLDFKAKQFLQGFESEARYVHSLWLGSFAPSEKEKLFSNWSKQKITNGNGLGSIDQYLSEVRQEDIFNQLLFTYYKTYLIEDILVKIDRASMFASLEVRSPFLDYRVVEFVNQLSNRYKLKGLQGKYILKSLMRGKLPNEIIDRPKKGFGIPLSAWLRKELKPLCQELLSKNSLAKHGLFNYEYVNQITTEHFSGKQNHRKFIWSLMNFQLWYNRYGT